MSAFIIDKSNMDLVVAPLRTLNIGNVEKAIKELSARIIRDLIDDTNHAERRF